MKLFRLCTDQIRLQTPLPWNVRNEAGQLLLSQGYLLNDARQLAALIDRGMYVDHDDYMAQQAAQGQPRRADPAALWSDIKQRVANLLNPPPNQPRPGHAQFSQDLQAVSGDLQHAVRHDMDAGVFEMISQNEGSYAVSHAVQTAFVACLSADHFGLSDSERLTLSNAAITMNMAMMATQDGLNHQALPLNPQQRLAVDAHSAESRAMLEQAGVTDGDWLRTVEQHHVTTDGGDLPADRSQLNDLACMIHYSDVYLAKISARAYRPALPAHVAARQLFVKSGGARNPYATAIIKEIGLYPPGSCVKLANGDTALVMRRGEQAHTPWVHSLICAQGQPYTEPLPRDTALSAFKVVDALPRGQVQHALQRSALRAQPAA